MQFLTKTTHIHRVKTISVCTLALISSLILEAQAIQVASGTVQRFEHFASAFVEPRTVDVWLPEGYDEKREYAVLYMHDGQMLFDSTASWNRQEWGVDETMQALIAAGKIRESIVVGIWNTGKMRHQEYFPQKPFESLESAEKTALQKALKDKAVEFEPLSDSYLKFIVHELKPFIDSSFSTKRNRSSTFIAGSSMGGLISLYAICEYPTVFGGAACMSTHWPGIFRTDNNPFPKAMLQYLENKMPKPQTHKIYFDRGTETLDSMYEDTQRKVDALMKRQGNHVNYMTREFTGDSHTEKAWARRLDIPLDFLLTKHGYPTYDGNPIEWDGSAYWGNIKSVQSESYFSNDSTRSNKVNGRTSTILFNEQWQVAKTFTITANGDTSSIHVPVYNNYGNMVIDNWLKTDGTLNSFAVHEYHGGLRQKVTEYSIFGSVSSVEEYTYDADTSVAIKRYFNSETKALDDIGREKTTKITRDGNLISSKSSKPDFILWQGQTVYTKFDKYGNWLEARTNAEVLGEIVEIISIRKIEYFQ